MSFANPLALLLLLAIPIILLFHLFQVQRRAVRVTTLRFWEALARQRQATRPSLRRLHLNLLLLLQILALLLIVLALARPTLSSVVQGWPRTVLIIDTSASMQATDVPGGRFAAARDQALAVLAALRPGQQAMLLEASSRPEVLVPFTDDIQSLRDALEALRPSDGPGRLDEAVLIASELVRKGPPAEIRLFTDAAFPHLSFPQREISSLRWHTVGRRADNVGITTLEVRENLTRGFDYQVYLALTNFSEKPNSFRLRLLLDGDPRYEQRFDLAGGVNRSLVIPFPYQVGGVLRAEIDLDDDMAVDNVAYTVLPEPRPLKVLLVSRGNLFLEEALRADAWVQLQIVTPDVFQAETSAADVAVLDGLSPDKLPPGRYLLVRSLADNAPLQQVGSVELPSIIDWDQDHPVMRYLDLSKVVIQRAMKVRPVGSGKPLAESYQTPLIYAWDEADIRAIFVGFDLYQSDLRVRAAFPLFVSNALRWLYPLRLEDVRRQFRAGEPIEADTGTSAELATVVAPNGRSETVPLAKGRLFYDGTRLAGLYTVQAGGSKRRYAVNLLDREESNLTPGRGAVAEAGRDEAVEASYRASQELWPLLAALALLVMAAEALLYWYRRRGSLSMASLLLRALVLLLAGLALLRPQMPIPSDAVHVVFLLDNSDSIPLQHQQQALEKIQAALRWRNQRDGAQLAVFAAIANLETLPEPEAELPPSSPVDGHTTDIAQGLRLALASLPRAGRRRILLLSDGNENGRASLDAAREAKRQGVAIYTIPIGGPAPGEVLLERMALPQEVKQGEPFDIRIIAWGDQEGEGRLSLYRNDSLVASQAVRLRAGKNVFSYQESQDAQGVSIYETHLQADGDAIEENNRALGAVAVHGSPQILYIEKDQEQGRYLLEALAAQHIQVDRIGLDGISEALARLPDYDALILSNVSALRLSKPQMEAIQRYVRDQGGGLLMLGGEESFGMGGYHRTPIEEALPVTMEVRQKIDVPSTTVILVIDRSGSMNSEQGPFTRMDLAKEAAQLAVELLSERSEVGVIAFDTAWNWAVPIALAEDKGTILQEIAAIEAGGGGTELFWAMEEVHRAIAERPTMLKHVIIVSDGEVPRAGFTELLDQMARDKITVSSVAISSEAGVELLRDISRWGRGRFYFTGDVYKIPRIFAMETQLASKAGLVERPFRPVVHHRYHEILKGIDWDQVPSLDGYVPTTPKETAETLLLSPQQEPILAVWRYGLGRAAAFTADAKARWGIRWLQWDEFGSFFSQLVRWTLRSSESGEVATRVRMQQGRGDVLVEAVDAEGEFVNFLAGEVGVVFPDQKRTVLPLVQSSPGRYQVSFPAVAQGTYLLGVSLRQGARTLHSEIGSGVAYSAEHRILSVNESLLRALAERSGGLMLNDPSEIFRHNRAQSSQTVDAWPWLLLLALLLLLADVALRWLRDKRARGQLTL